MTAQSRPKRTPWWILILTASLTFSFDQVTKWLIQNNLHYGETYVVLGFLEGIFDFTYTRNMGAAFGIGQGFGNIFLFIAIIVTAIIIYTYRQLPDGSWVVRIAMGFMLGGALGNAVDRIRLGYVVDFLNLHGWPIFNIADSSIVVGVVLWLLIAWWEERQEARQNATLSPESDLHSSEQDSTSVG